ncbi:MAG TPA: hypothetical protein VGB93_01305 [Methylovirgula sp.]
MKRRICIFIFLMLFASATRASSCGAQTDKVQARVDARLDAVAGTDPGARESRAALLHHEPTPASIAAAERGLKGQHGVERALAALKRARKAEARGDIKGCEAALVEARAAIAPR